MQTQLNDNEIIFEKDDVQKRWVEYISELFNDEDRKDITTIPVTEGANLSGPSILESEVKEALKKMKCGKATDNDEICKEMIMAYDELGIEKICQLANNIYDNGTMLR